MGMETVLSLSLSAYAHCLCANKIQSLRWKKWTTLKLFSYSWMWSRSDSSIYIDWNNMERYQSILEDVFISVFIALALTICRFCANMKSNYCLRLFIYLFICHAFVCCRPVLFSLHLLSGLWCGGIGDVIVLACILCVCVKRKNLFEATIMWLFVNITTITMENKWETSGNKTEL